jgi:hypothetical protein
MSWLADLLEDFGDEWLWRPALYYRWAFREDARLMSDRLARGMLRDIPLPVALKDQTRNAAFESALSPLTSRPDRIRHPKHFEPRVSAIRLLQFEGGPADRLGRICSTL